MNKKALILTLALALPASLTLAQRPGGGGPPPGGLPPGAPPPPPGQQQGQPQGEGNHPHGGRPPKGQPGMPPVPPLLGALDSDHDGIISADEIKAAADALLTLDKNKDGKLTPDEFLGRPPGGPPPGGPQGGGPNAGGPNAGGNTKPANRPAPGQNPGGPQGGNGQPQRPPPPPLVGALDADHDGEISAAEIADAAKALLTLDKNGDGQLGPGEYMGHPPGNGPKPPGGPAGPAQGQ